MFVAKARAGSAHTATHVYTWDHDGAVVEVRDGDAAELLAIPDGGFTEVRIDQAATVHPDVAADPGVVRHAGLIRLAVVAEMGTTRDELKAYADSLVAGLRDELLKLAAGGTAAPAAASTPGGPAHPDDAGPPGDAPATPPKRAAAARR